MIVKNLVIVKDKPTISFEQDEARCLVICSKQDENTTLLLRKIGGIETLMKTEEVVLDASMTGAINNGVRYFFKQGILLANLTLKENIALPYQYLNPDSSWADFEEQVLKWLDFFKLDIDLNSRPANVNHSSQKLIAYIRNLILKGSIYIVDDPFFQLSCICRKKVIDCLQLLKDDNNFLVLGTSDMEIIEKIADDIIVLERGEIIGNYTLNNGNRDSVFSTVIQYLGL